MDESSAVYARGLATKVVDHFLSKTALPNDERNRRRDLVLKYPGVVEAARAKSRQMEQGISSRHNQSAPNQA